VAEKEHGLPFLKDNIHTILYGSNPEKEKLKGQFFFIADTPEYMKKTSEQTALLDGLNSLSLPSVQRFNAKLNV
jgi:hypothetical protein